MNEPLSGRQRVVDALNEALTELDEGAEWENDTLPAFLEAFALVLGVIENSYTNTGQAVPDDPWELVSQAIRGARYYE